MKVLFDSVSGRIRSIPPSVSKQSRVNPAPKELKSRGLSQGARKRRPTIHLYLSFDCSSSSRGATMASHRFSARHALLAFAAACSLLGSGKRTAQATVSLQLRVLRFGFFQDRDVGCCVGIAGYRISRLSALRASPIWGSRVCEVAKYERKF